MNTPDQWLGDLVGLVPDALADEQHLTDTGNAQRLVDLMGGTIRYVHGWGCWIIYKDGRWIVDVKDALVTEKAKAVARSLMAMVPHIEDKGERDRVFAAAQRAESDSAIKRMIHLARAIQGVIVNHEQLDSDPYILNVANGTVDLWTGRLRPHDPDDLCTKQCPVDFDPDATAPLWEACQERWHPDPDLREYLQREAGAAATGRPTETLSIHIGPGANGKSKHFGSIQHVLGPYAVVPHRSLLIHTRYEQHPTEVANLFRSRLAVASETAASAHLNDAQIKALTERTKMTEEPNQAMKGGPVAPRHGACS